MFTREELQKMAAGGYIFDSEKERLALARQCLELMDVVDAARTWRKAKSGSESASKFIPVAAALDRLDGQPPKED